MLNNEQINLIEKAAQNNLNSSELELFEQELHTNEFREYALNKAKEAKILEKTFHKLLKNKLKKIESDISSDKIEEFGFSYYKPVFITVAIILAIVIFYSYL